MPNQFNHTNTTNFYLRWQGFFVFFVALYLFNTFGQGRGHRQLSDTLTKPRPACNLDSAIKTAFQTRSAVTVCGLNGGMLKTLRRLDI